MVDPLNSQGQRGRYARHDPTRPDAKSRNRHARHLQSIKPGRPVHSTLACCSAVVQQSRALYLSPGQIFARLFRRQNCCFKSFYFPDSLNSLQKIARLPEKHNKNTWTGGGANWSTVTYCPTYLQQGKRKPLPRLRYLWRASRQTPYPPTHSQFHLSQPSSTLQFFILPQQVLTEYLQSCARPPMSRIILDWRPTRQFHC